MTRAELMARLGVDELREWLAFDRIHPFFDGYWCAAMLAWVISRVNGAKRVKFEDFLPTRNPKVRKQTGAEMLAIVRRTAQRAQKRG